MNFQKRKEKLQKQIQNWQIQKQLTIQKQDLEEQKKEIKNRYKEQRKKLTTTKFLMLFLFISCSAIEFFTIFLTFKAISLGYVDFSALQSLITAVVAEVVGFAVYSFKSLRQNTEGGIVYQTAILNKKQEYMKQNNDQEAVG